MQPCKVHLPIVFQLEYYQNMADTDKVSFNISVVDLGKIDLLVEQGHYASRTDFLVAAVRTQLLTHTSTVQELFLRQSPVVGATIYGRKTLENSWPKANSWTSAWWDSACSPRT
jgi:hypothetical protein